MSISRPSWVHVTSAGLRWQVLSEFRDRLIGPGGLRLEEWLRLGQARIVKSGPHQTVYRVALPGLDFYLKHYRLMNLRAWLRQLVRAPKARREYVRALAVAAREVPTVTAIGVGERRRGPGPSYLLTRSLEDVEPLSLFIETTLPGFAPLRRAVLRQRLAHELGQLIARMHDAGIFHADLHAGNLLVSIEPDDRLRLHLIDLHDIRLSRPLDWQAARNNLIILNRWFAVRVSRSDRLRFFHSYWAERALRGNGRARRRVAPHPNSPPQGGRESDAQGRHGAAYQRVLRAELALDLEKRTWKSNLEFWRQRERRCLTTSRYYKRVRAASVAGYAVRDLDRSALAALLAHPNEPFCRPGTTILKHSASSTVAEIDLAIDGIQRRLIYKRFSITAWSDPWVALVRRSPALRSWIFGHSLRDRMLPTARPLAMFHRRRSGLPREGYLLTERIPDALDLRRYVAGLDDLPRAERQASLRRLIDQVAGLLRELHRRHLSHRDLKAANILVQSPKSKVKSQKCDAPQETDECGQLWLIDLAGVSRHHKLKRSRRVQNLARLHASFHQDAGLTRTDRLRFLRCYLRWRLVGRGGWKRWWRELDQATQLKIQRNLRSGRPLT